MSPQPANALPEHVLKPLCQPFSKEADCLLDLYEMTQQPRHPGKCVQCFFRLLAAAKPETTSALQPLRHWIEEHIEIAVRPAGSPPTSRLPVWLDTETLDQFCHQAIDRVRADTCLTDSQIELVFDYKDVSVG